VRYAHSRIVTKLAAIADKVLAWDSTRQAAEVACALDEFRMPE
jgi:hypothetical protein